jgi:hypothetical protein
VISPSDPSWAWTAKANKRVQFGYGLNYLIDVEHAVIVDVEATPARTYDEVAATRATTLRAQSQAARGPHGLRDRRHVRAALTDRVITVNSAGRRQHLAGRTDVDIPSTVEP